MTTDPADHTPDERDEHGADVIPLRAEDAHTETGLAEANGPAYLDTTGTGDAKRLPIIPEHLQRARIAKTAAEALGLHWYKARYHGLRAPVYAVKTVWYALRGTGRLTGRVLAWWHWTDGWLLESMAVAAGRSGHHDAMNAHREGKKTRGTRGQILAASVVGALVLLLVMVRFLPWWGWLAAAAVAVRVLARHGAPEGQPIIRAAIVPTAYQPPTPEVITRALGSLGHRRDQRRDQGRPGAGVRVRRAPRRRRLGRRAGPAARRHRLRHHQAPRGPGLGFAAPALGDLARGGARPSTPGGCTCGSAATTCPRPSPPPTRCSRPGPRTCSARCRSRSPPAGRASGRRCSKPTGWSAPPPARARPPPSAS